MSSLVLDLQQEVLKPDCDILNALRRAHLIATKLKLSEFDSWIMSELNGYDDNPRHGWIPVVIPYPEIEKAICIREMGNSISDILELRNTSGDTILMNYSGEAEKTINSICTAPFPTNFTLHISKHLLKSIIDKVGNCLLEWTIRLEAEGILGEDMRFSQEETNMAKEIPQQINNYYGTVVNGDVSQSQVVSGDHNSIAFNYGQASDLM